jgi:energy-coupling factor transport system ATP-binding protein
VRDSIIVTRKLTHVYHSGPHRNAALTDVSLEIARGSCAALIGVTGSGKSTLVQHLNGLLRPTSGALVVDGIAVHDRDPDLTRLRQRVGMLFQFAEAQLFGRTVYADVAFGPQRLKLSRHEVRARVLTALETVGLSPRAYAWRSPFELSGGQMRRVALAGVLAMTPTLLVLDEPTTGLDAAARAEFYHYVRRAQRERGVTVVLVSHDMAEVAALADQLFVLHAGRLVLSGAPRTVFAEAEQLRTWGLAAPPLRELLTQLTREGLDLPPDVLTLDEAFAALQTAAAQRQVR